MDCERHIDKGLVEDLMLCADTVCDVVRDSPCGCEGCLIWQTWCYDMKDGNPTEEELEDWKCPMHKVMDKLREQIGEENG